MRRRQESASPPPDEGDAREIKVLRRVADGLALELNNVLCSIIGRSSVLEAEMAPDDPARADVEAILAAGRAGLALTRSLTEFSDKTEFVKTKLSLNDIVGRTSTLWDLSVDRPIEIQTKLAPELREIEGDAARIRKLLHELGLNAIEAMPNGGTLTFTTANVTIAGDEPADATSLGLPRGEYVQLQVSDTGVGMAPETVRHALEPFFTTKQSARLTGLGLSQVSDIVRRHSAVLRLFSRAGLGTTVTIYFPALASVAPARAAQPAAAPTRHKRTVLMIDDDPYVLATGVRMLSRLGYNVVSANDAEEALEQFRDRQEEISVVIVDLVMPGTDGLAAIRAIKSTNPATRVILCSAYIDGTSARRAGDLGSDGILHKPYSLADLASAIESATRS